MLSAMKSGLTGIARFSGREAREPFWAYLGVVLGSCMVAGMAMMLTVMLPFFAKIDQFAREHPDQVTVQRSGGSVSYQVHGDHPELMPNFDGVLGWAAMVIGLAFVLLAAAVVRRLHDTGRSGLWGLPSLVLLAGLMAVSPGATESFDRPDGPDMALFGLAFLVQTAYLGSLALLAFFAAGRGTDGPNRFGPAPETKPPRRRA